MGEGIEGHGQRVIVAASNAAIALPVDFDCDHLDRGNIALVGEEVIRAGENDINRWLKFSDLGGEVGDIEIGIAIGGTDIVAVFDILVGDGVILGIGLESIDDLIEFGFLHKAAPAGNAKSF